MEIRIDTTKDSKEDIRKAIRFLESLADGATDQQPQSFPTGENVFGGMFDTANSAPSTPEQSKQTEVAENKTVKKEKISVSGLDVY